MNRSTISGGAPLRTAHISGTQAAQALVVMLRVSMWTLVVLSTIGTIYGVLRQGVPLWTPWMVFGDLAANPGGAAVGLALQLGLTLGQWGGIELAREDRRWWLVYAAALGASVVLNLLGYWEPLVVTAGLPWLLAVAAVVAGDVLPEWLLKR